jgi:hypothetical protein
MPGGFAVPLLLASALWVTAASPVAAQPIPGTTCSLFPANSIFNTDIASLPVNAQSAAWMGNMTEHANLHPDFGTLTQLYGMPINVAPPPTSGVMPAFQYNAESDHPAEGYPIDQNTLIEGGTGAPTGSDRHALTMDKNLCKLYEIYNLQNFTNGQTPQAGSGAVWDLNSNAMRPDGWTSADAAGLPIMPLLLRPDEILAGSIAHAIRFTTHCTHGYIWPGSHNAGICDATYPPMGARFRLRAGFDISGFSATTQVVLRAFQHYGLVLADNGSDWYFQGTSDNWWGTTAGSVVVSELKTIPAAQFDTIDESSLQAAAGSYAAAPPVPPTPGVYTGVNPVRLLDTRNDSPIGSGGSLNLAVRGIAGVPSNATAVVVNVTAVNESTGGAFTVYPAGLGRPLASNLNWAPHETVPNLVTVGVGPTGAITIFNGTGTADAVVDLEGYYAPSSGGTAGDYVPIVPARITDTRPNSGQANSGMTLGPLANLDVQVTGVGGIPSTGVTAVVMNVTATNTTAAGFFTAFPTGTTQPLASNLNWTAGVTVPNRVIVPVGTGGKVSVHNGAGNADLIVDVNGYFTDATGSGASFTALTPSRIVDTRNGTGGVSSPLGQGATMIVPVAGSGGVPSMSSATPPSAVVLNVTVESPTAASDLLVWPDGASVPVASDLNFAQGQTVPNLVIVKLSSAGKIDIRNDFGSTSVIVDVVGWYG